MRNTASSRSRESSFILLAVMIGLLAVLQPLLALALSALVLLALLLLTDRVQLPDLTLKWLSFSLAGYAVLGRGFAYLGVPPLFIGEVVLVLGLLALLRSGRWQLRHTPFLLTVLGLFILLQGLDTAPYLGRYNLDAIRDAALWYYALFALITAQLLLRRGSFDSVLQSYVRFIPYFLLLAPLTLVIDRLIPSGLIPRWPGSGAPMLSPKAGDLAVHLAGILSFMLLGMQQQWSQPQSRTATVPQPTRASAGSRDWLWWTLWLLAAVSTFTGRAALVTVGVAGLVTLLLRPLSRWGRPLYLAVLLILAMLAVDFRVTIGSWDKRELSVEGIFTTLRSVTSDTKSTRDATRAWRLEWWNKIVNYTVHGPYFWTGKGYGINLADSDGFQVQADGSLRSPHNGHLNILARSGVPGFSAWVLLQLAFGVALLKAHWRARVNGRQREANLFLWIFAYWLAFLVNASFDVYLEGPQGGIWFWSLFGFGLAALEQERRAFAAQERAALTAPQPSEPLAT